MKHEAPIQVEVKNGSCQEGDLASEQEVPGSRAEECDARSRSVLPPNLTGTDWALITPEMLTLVDLNQHQIDFIVRTVSGGASNVQDIYPLSPLQEGILFHHLMNQHGDAYLLSILLELQSHTQVDALIDALQNVIDRHDILRTAVLSEGVPRPVQVVYRRATLPVNEIVVDGDGDPIEQLKERMRPERQRMDLTQAPLMRLHMATDAHKAYCYGLLQIHHLVCDYRSWEAVVAELMAYLEGRERDLPSPVAYRNYVAQALADDQTQDAEAFFRSKFDDVDEPTAPFGVFDVHGDGTHSEEARQALDPVLAHRIRFQARRLGVSAARLFHAAWGLVVAGTSGQDDVVYGTVLAARQMRAPTQQMLGMFVNTLPLRLRFKDITAKELVEQTHRELSELLGHQAAPLALAQRCSGIAGAAPLFTALLNYRRSTSNSEADNGSAKGVRVLARRGVWTNYPVALSVDDLGEGFILTAQTDPRIDPQRIMGYVHAAMQSLVDALEHAPQTPALALSILPDSERHQVIHRFNATQAAYTNEMLVHELFETQVERTPDSVAVVCGDRQLTYAQLNRQANQLAHALLARGVRPDARVGLYLDRSVETVVGLLGILKAGGAYVPMDVGYPRERLSYMVADSTPVVLLTQERLKNAVAIGGAEILALDTGKEEIDRQPDCNPGVIQSGLQPRHLAYVIYTSGSTGVPKGVMVEHRNLVNLIRWHCAAFELKEGCRSSSVAAVGFDAAGWEIWPPLSVGATLVFASSEATEDVEKLLAWWGTQPLDVSFLPTPMAEFAFSRNIRSPQLRALLVGGDRLRYRPASESFALVNNYGPTEATVVATSGRIHCEDSVLHIGQPIANTQIYILDRRQQAVPIGVSGEMYVGGAGVARGYLNRPDLTAERFIPDSFTGNPQARLYRTGDLGRWRTDGVIEYLGRNDHQVKIRGYRIELGEIEAQLVHHAQVKDAVVVAREDVPGDAILVAYCTLHDQIETTVDELRAHLKAVLPEYMVPTAFVMLERFPLTPNGKLDRRALPAPELGAYVGSQYQPPQGEVENRLARIWQELLHVRRVGQSDNFFELGGHSILAVKSLFNINQSFGCALRVTDVYKNPTLRDLAARIGGRATEDELVDLSREATLDEEVVAIPGLRRAPAQNVMLTGGTGFIGRFLLAQLLDDTDATVYCVVRAQSQHHAMSRLRGVLLKWNLWRDQFEQRIVAVPGDLRHPRLGIDEATYQSLSQNIDSIYHCATSMNHLESYAMAKPVNVEAARELLKLATQHKPKLINYISTLSVFRSSTSGAPRVVDEESLIDDEEHSMTRGYVASKWVGEKIFMTAGERGIPCNIFRVGFVWADTQQGRYDELQQGYRIFKSCLLSGCGIECYRYQMAPTPVDYVARSIVFLANRHCDGQGIFHISSSHQLIEGVFERCNEIAGTSLDLMPYYDWICEIKRLHQEGRVLPAVPLIEFAFSMNEESFDEYQRNVPSSNIRFDCTRTHRELEGAGILAPALDDELLRVFVESILSTDAELRGQIDSEKKLMVPGEMSV